MYPTATNIPAESLGIIAGGDDGSLHFWDQRQSSNFCKCTIHEAHDMGKVSSLAISHCGKYIASRGEDAAVKVWDIRMLSGKTKGDAKAISVYKGYPLTTDREDICFNPTDNKLCLTTSISKLDKQTKQRSYENELVVLRRDQVDNTPYYVKNMTEISEGSKIIRTFWHDRLNQILMACENGKIHTMYDEIRFGILRFLFLG